MAMFDANYSKMHDGIRGVKYYMKFENCIMDHYWETIAVRFHEYLMIN